MAIGDRVAMVTGAGSGIGRVTALALVDATTPGQALRRSRWKTSRSISGCGLWL